MLSEQTNSELTLEEDLNNSNYTSLMRNIYNTIKRSNVTAYLLMSLYITVCLLGNVVTGIIFFKHHDATLYHKENMGISKTLIQSLSNRRSSNENATRLQFESKINTIDDLKLQTLSFNESNDGVSWFWISWPYFV